MRRYLLVPILIIAGMMLTQGSSGLFAAQPYVLGPEDAIEVGVWGEPSLTTTVTIRPDGTVTLPLIGAIRASGFTPEQFAAAVEQGLKRFLKAPRVQVTVRTFRPLKVYVLGEVARPGEFAIRPGQGVAEILAAAGGPGPRADLRRAIITREQRQVIQIDLALVMNGGGPSLSLEQGDVIIVPRAERRVVILGQVTKPGTYEIEDGDRISNLLSLAGGPTQRAGLKRTTLVRGQQTIPVDLDAILAKARPEANLKLEPGDLILVPEYQQRVAVLGSVARPGAYDLREGDRLVDLLAVAGGTTNRAYLDEVGIIRQVNGKPTITKVSVIRALRTGDATQNPLLENGDLVFVADRGVDWSSILSWLSGLNLVKGLFGLP